MTPERRTILILFAIALGVRVLYTAFAGTQPDIMSGTVTGELNYAKKIASGLEWIKTPSSPLSPGYPVLLALFYLVSFKQLWMVLFFQSALGAATVLLLHRMGVDLLGKTMGLIAALWFAASVLHMQYSSLFTRDVLAVFLLLLTMFLIGRPLKRMRFAVVTGIAYAALIHVDPQFVLLFPLFAVFILLFKSRYNILNLQYFFLFASTVFLVSAPWTIRNQVVYRQVLPVSLEASKYFRPLKVFVSEKEKTITSIEQRIGTASRTRRIQTNTMEFWRFARFADTPNNGPAGAAPAEPAWSLRHNLISIVSYGLLLPFFLVGMFLAIRKRARPVLMIGATVLIYYVMRAYLGGGERARLLADPLIILIAFYGIVSLTQRFSSQVETTNDQSQ